MLTSLTKTTIKFAEARNMDLLLEDGKIFVYELGDDCEWLFSFNVTEQSIFWGSNIHLPQRTKEEIPHFIGDEKGLRSVLNFVATELAA